MARKLTEFMEEVQRILGKSPAMAAYGWPAAPDRVKAAVLQRATSRGGRHRQKVRDKVVATVCRHLDRQSEWSKLPQKQFAGEIYKQFNEAVSEYDIKQIIRVATDVLSRP
jgi:hypothetical protein